MSRLVCGAALALAVSLTTPRPSCAQTPAPERTTYDDMRMFSQALNQIRINHADSVTAQTLLLAAVEGMIAAADPHSYLLPASRTPAERELEVIAGRAAPVPVTFTYVGDVPLVVSVAPGTAAARADVRPGDELVSVDGAAVRARSAEELDLALAGKKGSDALLVFERQRADGSRARLERKLKRERPEELAVVAAPLDAETGYLRITSFRGSTVADETASALGKLESQGMKRLVLDLRDNPGGAINQAAAVAGLFLPATTVIAVNEYRRGKPDTLRVESAPKGARRNLPLVVLVGAGTASAAELLAGALQDHDRALIVGRPTFGKALVLRPFPLADGSVMWLAVGRTHTPCGRMVQRDYRRVSAREYMRGAGAARDSTGRPSCRSDAGRTLLGGGGIEPDQTLPKGKAPAPWLLELFEDETVLQWLGRFQETDAKLFATPADVLDPAKLGRAVGDLRSFAAGRGRTVPAGEEGDAALRDLMVPALVWTRFGPAERYRTGAKFDEDVAAAVKALPDAAALPGR